MKSKGPLACANQDADPQDKVTTAEGAVIRVRGGHTLIVPPGAFPANTTIGLEVTADSLAFNITANQPSTSNATPLRLIVMLEDCGQGKPFNARLSATVGGKKLEGMGHNGSGNAPSLAMIVHVMPSDINKTRGPRTASGWIFIGD